MSPGASLLVDGEDILMRPPVAAPSAAAAASFGRFSMETDPKHPQSLGKRRLLRLFKVSVRATRARCQEEQAIHHRPHLPDRF